MHTMQLLFFCWNIYIVLMRIYGNHIQFVSWLQQAFKLCAWSLKLQNDSSFHVSLGWLWTALCHHLFWLFLLMKPNVSTAGLCATLSLLSHVFTSVQQALCVALFLFKQQSFKFLTHFPSPHISQNDPQSSQNTSKHSYMLIIIL